MGSEESGGDWDEIFMGPDIDPVVEAAERLFGIRFGGAWYRDEAAGGQFVVAVVGADGSDARALRAAVGGDTSWLDVVGVKYSNVELLEFLERLTGVLDRNRPSQSMVVGPDCSNNRVKVGLNPQDADRLIPLLKAAVPDDALAIEVSTFVARGY